ncbi:Protein kinase, catalytic domain-containing protein [Cynara cardunculus var. scolymus]|uniref:Protein kinase, catalytic domain-containing protein n=1 Tax=Cynara cardunculus var. scolymus TaxID=59895 RepID=A0A103YDN3_CYNCS|nr:Protein kinase, catalytic domain-containing protein [Cynara cardunculus var. scolymus]
MESALDVGILGRDRHKNLLEIRGFHAWGDQRIIVYDYMHNHSLLTHLHGQLAANCLLDWPQRMNIAIGSAEGLADINANNVLLDSEYLAKVADFMMAKLVPDGVTHMSTRVKGSLGYLAPDYAMWGKVSRRSDVYSFGLLLLEILSAKKPLEKLPEGFNLHLVEWATPLVEHDAYDQLADS